MTEVANTLKETPWQEVALAQAFRRVRYEYHRDFFALLGYSTVATQFEAIWALCEPKMANDPHVALVNEQEPHYWVPLLESPEARKRFFDVLSDVLEQEAQSDEKRGRVHLANLLREVVQEIRQLRLELSVG